MMGFGCGDAGRADLQAGGLLEISRWCNHRFVPQKAPCVPAGTPCDWAAVHEQAQRLSAEHTIAQGHRGMDLLHVASALVLGAPDFLTFDQNQAQLAAGAGLVVRP